MECLYQKDGEAAFWCPRCGTVKSPWLTSPDGEAPKLVERCRLLSGKFDAMPDNSIAQAARELWKSFGIAESIHTPDQRKT
jgi:hypothetical protein